MSRDWKGLRLRGHDHAHGRDAAGFDPVAEGDKLGLPRAISLAIWEQACREATDASGWLDARRAEHQFRMLAERAAAQRGRRHPDPGRATRVGVEQGHEEPEAWSMDSLGQRVPGRDTLVLATARAEARRAVAAGLAPKAAATVRSEPPVQPRTPMLLQPSVGAHLSRMFGVDLTRVQVVPDSPAATGSTKAVTKGEVVHFRAGAYQPGTTLGDELIAHELAHVVQQRGDGGQRGSTQQIEREADRAARLAMRGRAAPITLRAEPGIAYAFNESEAHEDADVDDHEQPDRAGARDQARPTTHEPAPASHDEATAHGHAEPDVGHDGLADVAAITAVLPAEDASGVAPSGGGGPAAKPSMPIPGVATAKPEQGLAQMHGVRPDRLIQLFGPLRSVNSADIAKTRATQHANPPKQMSTGAPTVAATGKPKDGAAGGPGAADANAIDADAAYLAGAKAALPVQPDASDTGAAKQAKQAKQDDVEAQRAAVEQIVAATKRQIASWFNTSFDRADAAHARAGDKMSDQETRQLSGSIDQIPTTVSDVSTETGPTPELAMKHEAQASAARERAELEKTVAAHQTLSRADSRAPMGEDHIDPGAAPEELIAVAPAAANVDAALPTVAGAASSEEAGIIAQEQQGAEIDAALAKASVDITAAHGKHDADEARARAESDTRIRELKANADADQEAARVAAHTEVSAARGQWQSEIDRQGADARRQGDQKVAEGMAQVAAEEAKANAEAKKHIDEGKQKADDEKQKGEQEAADAKRKGKEKSAGAWGWLKSKARAAVDGIKQAVSSAIDACRRAVKAVIAAAKKLAMAVIEAARKVITSVIKAVGKALLAISDVLLAAFPGLKARFQAAIKKAVDKAVGLVNKLADRVKQGVQKALDALGATLDKALQLLENGINAIIDAAASLVQAAIKAAQAIVDALGTWAKLIKDVASGPGAWIKNLGAAIVDGIKNHLWAAFKTAVVEWFKSKVFELLGIGGIILELLLEGGLTREHIIQMALDALMIAIPAALMAILIEKLVSMIVPAAGAVMVIIEGLQAAWGTLSRIIAAFSAFVAFLLAVKGGTAGALFAGVLASAAVVVLDFVASWLLKKLAGAARKVGAKLKGLAEKFKAKRKAKKDSKKNAKHHQHHSNDSHHDQGAHHDKDKKRDDKHPDAAAVRKAAHRAADHGWRAASRRCHDRVVRAHEVEAAMRAVAGAHGGIRVDLEVSEAGSSWHVKAHASKGTVRASADAGRGWIARAESGERWYAARDLTSFNETLVKEALGELKRPARDHADGDLHQQYQHKVQQGAQVKRRLQPRLDGKLHGLVLEIKMEPFSGVEQDKKVQTTVTVAPNMTKEVGQIELDARFPYEVGAPQAPTKVARIGAAKTYLRPIPIPPMKSPADRWPGYVINMAAIPGEVKSGMAVRYAEGAWHDADEKALGAKRTGVVVGVNTRVRLDEKADHDDRERVAKAVQSIDSQDSAGNHITMAAFGFAWEPSWIHKTTGARAPMAEVRAAFQKLEGEDKVNAAKLDKVNAKTLPYGIFREEVIGSDYTRTAASLIAAIADPVHILSQDADGKVAAASGKGVLAEYDAVLRAMDRQPMLVIGGYNFDHFEWDAHDPQRKQQLTRLANELDRAIRAAIAKLYPDMLYPSEPNTLMKATDERDGGGIFQDPQHLRDLDAAHVGADGDRMGAFYGLGQNEGRNAMLRRREVAGDSFSMGYEPSASTTTSPLPNDDARGLVRHSGMIYDAADGTMIQDGEALALTDRKHPHTGITTQSQSFANPRTQAREYDKATPVVPSMPQMSPEEEKVFRGEHRQTLRNVFATGEAAQRDLVKNPALTLDSPEMQRHRKRVDDIVQRRNAIEGPASREAAQRAIHQAGEICKQLITSMSSSDLRSIWQRLHDLLGQVMNERPSQGSQT